MATLAESFLADLEDLSDGEEAEPQPEAVEEESTFADLDDDVEELNFDDLAAVAKLRGSERYKSIMKRVAKSLEETVSNPSTSKIGAVEEEPEYSLIVECNELSVDIDNEIAIIHNFIQDKYRHKFPELESLVMHPIDYARVVKAIGNEEDMTNVNLDGLLPSVTIMVVCVTGSTTNGKPLDEENLRKCLEACDVALEHDENKKRLLEFVESRMASLAPNLSAVVGSEIAAKLMGVAGGLSNLSKMPACNVQVLGTKRKRLDGYSTSAIAPHVGFLGQSEIVQSTPPSLQPKAIRLLAGKCTLMARVDANGEDHSGDVGTKMMEEVKAKIEKWQEPPPAKQPKPLPMPDEGSKKRRGGRRLRKMKERYGMTDMRKHANRVNFNQAEEDFGDNSISGGLGTLGAAAGSGKIRVSAQKSKLAAVAAKKYKDKKFGSSAGAAGTQSSLAFTPIQGIELANPEQRADPSDGTESYFSEFSTGAFSKIRKL
mmetsp:Transcript_13965/g.16868  ORF Transcript_13965/g.16868 Transcript_13965/m.16868 type:complete len:486 (-) Transcript_13965:233-1690(-)|eukprot:CAMPEP_0197864746 /NCGR_PEP_ID=MMETSP1438-20131217/43225_1 /TAXON_ID=1461541 /ORGANISM="Pterosperma sp., Strain CCMP1384" /LENGTH=485 /DNA_ID=CAMNT_0043483109 /DNA_START=337 /DNA_END=1794 /DNA_ORIENTATION=+